MKRSLIILAMSLSCLAAAPATKPAVPSQEARITALEKQVTELQKQIADLQGRPATRPVAATAKTTTKPAAKLTNGLKELKIGASGLGYVIYVEKVVDEHSAILRVAQSDDGKGYGNYAEDVYVTGMDTTGMVDDEEPTGNTMTRQSGFRALKITGTKKVPIVGGTTRTILQAEEVR